MALSNALELAIHRKGTKRFVDADPTDIVLFPKTGSFVDGTKIFTAAEEARESQQFKVIWGGESGIVREVGPPGGVRRFDFILVGEYDAAIEIGDTWSLDDQAFVVEYVFPNNGYEIKAGGVSHGSKPTG